MSESSTTSTATTPKTKEEEDGKIGKPGDKPQTGQGGGDQTLKEQGREHAPGSEGDGP